MSSEREAVERVTGVRRRFYVHDDGGWKVRDRRDSKNVYGPGWCWNSRSVARCVGDEYESVAWTPEEEARLAHAKDPRLSARKATPPAGSTQIGEG